MGWLGTPHTRPSDQMLAVLTGRLHHDDAPAAIQSLCSKAYFDAAVDLIQIKDKETRKKMLQSVPETCRDEIAKEVVKLWPIRAQLLK